MKNFKIITIIFIGCVVHQSYAGGPAGIVSDEISDMTAGSVGRNVSREAAGEVASEAARVANKPSFAFHKRPSTFGTLAPPEPSPALGTTTIPEEGLASGLPKGFTKRASYIKTSERGFTMVPGKSKRLTVETPQPRGSISAGHGAVETVHRGSFSMPPHVGH